MFLSMFHCIVCELKGGSMARHESGSEGPQLGAVWNPLFSETYHRLIQTQDKLISIVKFPQRNTTTWS